MARKTLHQAQTKSASRSWRDPAAAASAILLAGTIAIPLFISPTGEDVFRWPKELAFRAIAVLLTLVAVFAVTAVDFDWRKLLSARREIGMASLILFWTAITALTSTNRRLSYVSLMTVAASLTVFLAARLAAKHVPVLWWLDLLFAGACLNSLLVCAQESGLWNPFVFQADLEPHMKSSAFLGNPNDVGAYLIVPALACAIAARIARNRRRQIYAVLAVVIAGGVIATGTRAAIAAYVFGLIVFAFSRRPRQTAVAVALAALVVATIFATQPSTPSRVRSIWAMLVEKRYDVLFSERLPAFLSAWEMARSHPFAGVGPGCFKYNYMQYRVALRARYPPEWLRGYHKNFGEVHNDHLQVLAETGMPGYCLFLASVLAVAGVDGARQKTTGDEPEELRAALAGNLRLPLACVFFLLALAQFPLQLAAPRFVFLATAGLCMGWRRDP